MEFCGKDINLTTYKPVTDFSKYILKSKLTGDFVGNSESIINSDYNFLWCHTKKDLYEGLGLVFICGTDFVQVRVVEHNEHVYLRVDFSDGVFKERHGKFLLSSHCFDNMFLKLAGEPRLLSSSIFKKNDVVYRCFGSDDFNNCIIPPSDNEEIVNIVIHYSSFELYPVTGKSQIEYIAIFLKDGKIDHVDSSRLRDLRLRWCNE